MDLLHSFVLEYRKLMIFICQDTRKYLSVWCLPNQLVQFRPNDLTSEIFASFSKALSFQGALCPLGKLKKIIEGWFGSLEDIRCRLTRFVVFITFPHNKKENFYGSQCIFIYLCFNFNVTNIDLINDFSYPPANYCIVVVANLVEETISSSNEHCLTSIVTQKTRLSSNFESTQLLKFYSFKIWMSFFPNCASS